MTERWRVDSAAVARRVMARTLIGDGVAIPDTLGDVVLRAHQRSAAARLDALVAAHGGALLAEPVGVGKTYTALAVAARAELPIVIAAPAALRAMWRDALAQCRVAALVITHEALSRGVRFPESPSFLIVDEAHRLRSPGTRRYAALAELCRRCRVLLVSATPVHNRQADLAAELALFLGRGAWAMTDDELARHVVRGTADDACGLPRLVGPHRLTLDTFDDCLDEVLALPPPVPARHESVAAALLSYGLIHQWTSSRAALSAALGRRRARGLALSSAVEAGRVPGRAELSAWTHSAGAMQLAFPEIVTFDSSGIDADADANALRIALDRHDIAVAALLRRLKTTPSPDVERAALLRRIRVTHPGERIIAFCHYADTVAALRAQLARDSGVAALSARGALIASGRVSREAVLAQFTPPAHGAARPRDDRRAVDRIDLLITTDLLSEGLNLQEASVVVHLDFPWNPARLDQRVGRVLRMGSRHRTVTVYAVAPPAAAERVLRIERRLRDKLIVAQRTVGVAGQILPSILGVDAAETNRGKRGIAERASIIDRILRDWLSREPPGPRLDSDTPIVGAVLADVAGYVALVRHSRGAELVADLGTGPSSTTAAVAVALAAANGRDTDVDADTAAAALSALELWLAAHEGATTIDLHAAAAARSRRAALHRVAQTLARTPRHRRTLVAPLADAARAVATAPLGEGAERILDTLVHSELPDEAWLRALAAFGSLNARPGQPAPPSTDNGPRVLAMILLRRPRGS